MEVAEASSELVMGEFHEGILERDVFKTSSKLIQAYFI